ncbi:hypothetical protein ABN028_03490 [Actinopolymorpha sp. B17G11]|uniref:hypothetical protein n=1 Tax=Actinopolymorpha sp. B17G11 TaxID=3160861 RepID=UPI0032E37F0D
MYDNATWFPICAALSAVGVVAAFFAFRRRGLASGLRLLGWAVLPMAIYLTGMVRLLWTIGAAVGKWVSGFVFSPFVWAGVALFGFAAIALPVAGALRRRKAGREVPAGEGAGAAQLERGVTPGTGAVGAAASGTKGKPAEKKARKSSQEKSTADKGARDEAAGQGDKSSDPLEGMEDIEDILKRRGIS